MPLKRPVALPQARRWPAAAKRRQSFCARMGGMRERLTGERAARDPASPINRALAAWDCDKPELLRAEHVSKGIRMKITKGKVGSEAKPARKNPAPGIEEVPAYRLRPGMRIAGKNRQQDIIIDEVEGGIRSGEVKVSSGDFTRTDYFPAREMVSVRLSSNPARKTPAPAKVKTWAVFKVGMKTPVAVFASRADAVKFGQSWADIHKSPVQVIAG